METLGHVLLWLLAGLAAAGLRGPVESLARAVLGLPAHLLTAGADAAAAGRRHLLAVAGRTAADLAYGPDETGVRPGRTGWDVTAPLVYAVLLAVVGAGDLVLATLRFGALLGIPIGVLPVGGDGLDLLAGLLFVSVLATYGCVLLDAAHVSPLRRPYGLATGRARRLVLAAAATGAGLSLVSAVLFFVWGQQAIAGDPDADVADLFVAVFALILGGASILAFGGAVAAVPACWSLLLRAGAAVLAVAARVLELAVVLLDGVHRLLVAAVRLVAAPGRIVWNWLAGLGFAGALRIGPLPEPDAVAPLVDPVAPARVTVLPSVPDASSVPA